MDTKQKYTGKRRGRKPKKPKDVTNDSPPKKKRGRKPKKKPKEVKPKIPKKRGRKPQNKSYGFNKKINVVPIANDNIIIHLPIKDIYRNLNNVENILNYSPIINLHQ